MGGSHVLHQCLSIYGFPSGDALSGTYWVFWVFVCVCLCCLLFVCVVCLLVVDSTGSTGGLVGTFLIMWTPYNLKIPMRILGVLVMFLKCFERLVLGFHSLGQVLTGCTLGIGLSIYSELVPQYFIIFDSFAQIFIGALSLSLDQELEFTIDDPNNLVSWYMWGVAQEVIALPMAAMTPGGVSRRQRFIMESSLVFSQY